MGIDTKHEDLQSLRIDRTQRGDHPGEPSPFARRFILIGVAVVVLLGLFALAYRAFSSDTPEVEVVRASADTTGNDVGGTVLSATGYIVAHHTINVNSKVTGRLKWIGVEKGDKVKEGQILVRLEDDEFRAAYQQAQGAVENAKAYLEQLQHGSRPEEIQQAQHNLDEARATLANDKLTLDRIKELASSGVVSRQQLDDATAKFESDQQRANSLERAFQLAKIGPRTEEIARAQGALLQAQGQLEYARAQLDATLIRAPVTGTILDRTAEKGELITAQFASAAAGGPQGSVVSLADLNDLQVELDIAQADFARLSPNQKAMVTTDAYPDKQYDGQIRANLPGGEPAKGHGAGEGAGTETRQVSGRAAAPGDECNGSLSGGRKAEGHQGTIRSIRACHGATGQGWQEDRVPCLRWAGGSARSSRHGNARTDLVDGLVGGESVITTAPATLKDGDKIEIKGQS